MISSSPRRAPSAAPRPRVQPRRPDAPAHDAFTRLLHRLEPDPATLGREVAPLVERERGVLVVDDTTLDKPYARKMALVHRHWSGKHHAVVDGINLITLLWTEGESLIPCDWRVFDKPNDGMTKNEHFLAMLLTAKQRGFAPECVLFDGWYASIDGCPLGGMRLIRDCGWRWLTRLQGNRLVNPDRTGNRAVAACDIAETGTVVWLKEYGLIRVFRIVTPDGETEHRATNDGAMEELERLKYAEFSWGIEVYHRALKQECGSDCRAGRHGVPRRWNAKKTARIGRATDAGAAVVQAFAPRVRREVFFVAPGTLCHGECPKCPVRCAMGSVQCVKASVRHDGRKQRAQGQSKALSAPGRGD